MPDFELKLRFLRFVPLSFQGKIGRIGAPGCKGDPGDRVWHSTRFKMMTYIHIVLCCGLFMACVWCFVGSWWSPRRRRWTWSRWNWRREGIWSRLHLKQNTSASQPVVKLCVCACVLSSGGFWSPWKTRSHRPGWRGWTKGKLEHRDSSSLLGQILSVRSS